MRGFIFCLNYVIIYMLRINVVPYWRWIMSLFKKNVKNEVVEPTVFADSPGEGVYLYYNMDELFAPLEFIVVLLNLLCIWSLLS